MKGLLAMIYIVILLTVSYITLTKIEQLNETIRTTYETEN